MENFRLRVFRAVAEEMSFQKAAKVLHLSQPAVSQHIRALEEEAGVQLFTIYSGHRTATRLLNHVPPKKIGINSRMEVALIAAPDGFEELLGDLPEKTALLSRLRPTTSLAFCFIRSLADLASTLDLLTVRLPRQASVWIVHPKRTGKHHVDFNQNHVRDESLAAGLVDYKVCSIDNDWSALKFAWRKR
ncbi:LysR family transcriptional regulator [Tunturiibacter gelidiferens]|uniref:helix-turn-helix domain-containing protein n=1 Tax=Tunturiibacter gelidiferens TaxID=3069689 RepID=UPI003D9B19F7